MHTHAQVLVRYTWSGVPKLALPLDRVQNQRTCYFCNLFTLGYRSDGRVAGGTQADAIYGRVEKREEGKGETFLRWQPLLDFSIAIRSIAVRNRRFRVFRTKFFHSELWDRVLFEFLILYPSIGIRCLSWRDWGREKGEIFKGGLFSEGEISFIGIRIRWYSVSFTIESQGWKQFEFVEIYLDLIERYFETKLLIGADPNLIFVDFLNNENVFEIKIL